MVRTPTSRQEYYEAKAAFKRAETEWRRIANVYWAVWRSKKALAAEPSEEFKRVRRAYEAASAVLSEARERLRLLQTAVPLRRKHKPFKYGLPSHEVEDA